MLLSNRVLVCVCVCFFVLVFLLFFSFSQIFRESRAQRKGLSSMARGIILAQRPPKRGGGKNVKSLLPTYTTVYITPP